MNHNTRRYIAAAVLLCAVILLAVLLRVPKRGGLFVSPFPLSMQRQIYVPMTAAYDPMHSTKKGTWRPDCQIDQGLGWSFVGDACEGIEYIPYLTHPAQLEVFEPSSTSGNVAMFFNEPDLYPAPWNDMVQLVRTQAVMEARWPGREWVGPCVSQIGGAAWLAEYATTYRAIVGRPLDVSALCVHCYGTAAECKILAGNVTSLAASFGVGVWVTEFGYPCGTEAEAIIEAGEFAAWLDANPLVERWAYWPGTDSGPEEFDWDFWKPLVRDGELTEMGRAFQAWPR